MNVHNIKTAPSNQASSCSSPHKRRRALPVAVYAKGGLQSGDRLLPLTEVERMTSAKKSWIYYRIGQGLFPRPIRLCAGRRVAWSEQAVQAWIKAQQDAAGGLIDAPESNTEGEKV